MLAAISIFWSASEFSYSADLLFVCFHVDVQTILTWTNDVGLSMTNCRERIL